MKTDTEVQLMLRTPDSGQRLYRLPAAPGRAADLLAGGMYWVYEVQTFTWRNQLVHAHPEAPPPQRAHTGGCGYDFPSPLQDAPYGVNLNSTLTVNQKHPHPDNYANGTGFMLFSDRLIQVMRNHRVNFESFPLRMVDQDNKELRDLHYASFHSLKSLSNIPTRMAPLIMPRW